jgi:hypothetical protein
MSKRDDHRQDLKRLTDALLSFGDAEYLTGYLLANSDLPGRRANLELAGAFGDLMEGYVNTEKARLWAFCTHLTSISATEAPAGTAEEFLPFCGTVGVGGIGATSVEFYDAAIAELKALANDTRWRLREAVCFGLQRLMAARTKQTLGRLSEWATAGSLLEMRAAAAAVAEPALLENDATAAAALGLHARLFERIADLADRRQEDFKVLRKGLGYTLSVVVSALPGEGFTFMERLAASRDSDVLWILKQNLRKKRLAVYFPEEVAAIQRSLE